MGIETNQDRIVRQARLGKRERAAIGEAFGGLMDGREMATLYVLGRLMELEDRVGVLEVENSMLRREVFGRGEGNGLKGVSFDETKVELSSGRVPDWDAFKGDGGKGSGQTQHEGSSWNSFPSLEHKCGSKPDSVDIVDRWGLWKMVVAETTFSCVTIRWCPFCGEHLSG